MSAIIIIISNGNRTEWSTIQGVIGRVISNRFEITSAITPELYDTKSYYQLIVTIKKIEIGKSLRTSFLQKNHSFVQSTVQTARKNPF